MRTALVVALSMVLGLVSQIALAWGLTVISHVPMQTVAVLVFSIVIAAVSIGMTIKAGCAPKPMPVKTPEQDWRSVPAFGGHQVDR